MAIIERRSWHVYCAELATIVHHPAQQQRTALASARAAVLTKCTARCCRSFATVSADVAVQASRPPAFVPTTCCVRAATGVVRQPRFVSPILHCREASRLCDAVAVAGAIVALGGATWALWCQHAPFAGVVASQKRLRAVTRAGLWPRWARCPRTAAAVVVGLVTWLETSVANV